MFLDVTPTQEGMWGFLISFANRHPLMVIGIGLVLLSSISNLSTKKVKVKTNYHMTMWFFFAGLGCMGLDLWQSNSLPIKHKEKPALNHNQISADLKRKVENYLEALQSKDYDRISPFFPNTLDSYFGEDKVTYRHVWRRMKQDWKNMLNETINPMWETWKYKHDEEKGRYIVSFSFKHAYQTSDTPAKDMNQEKAIELSFDRNYQIYRVDKPTID